MTAKHSFLQVNRLPRRKRKVPEVAVTGGGVCLHSGSSTGIGAGLMLNVAPGKSKAESKMFPKELKITSTPLPRLADDREQLPVG